MFGWLSEFIWQLFQRLPEESQGRLLVIIALIAIIAVAISMPTHRRNVSPHSRKSVGKPITSNVVAGRATTKLKSSDCGPSSPVAVVERPTLSFATGFTPQSAEVQKGRLVVFVHGLLGSGQSTWGQFPEFLLSDPVIAGEYDVATFGYRSGLLNLGQVPKLEDIAGYLDDELETKHANYSEIVIFAHSMGGLITRRYLADALARAVKPGGKPCRVSRVLYFATPHRGSALATIAGLSTKVISGLAALFGSAAQSIWDAAVANGTSEQLKALASGSDFLFQLERDEESVFARDRITMHYVVAEFDPAVERNSAVGSSNFHTIPDSDHWSVVDPTVEGHGSVLIASQFLKETRDRVPYAAQAELKQPVLKRWRAEEKAAGIDPHKAFVYKNQVVPFVGREDDIAYIEEFRTTARSGGWYWPVLAVWARAGLHSKFAGWHQHTGGMPGFPIQVWKP